MRITELRKDYLKITIIFYFIWVIIFILDGLYANTLPTSDLSSAIDEKIPLYPGFVWFYVLCYVFPFLPLFVIKDWHRFNIALLSVVICTLIAFIGHLTIPIAFPRPQLGLSISERLLSFIYLNDFRPGAQNFPSLHVSISWIIYFAIRHQGLHKVYEYLILLCALFIIMSTVLIKQHLFIDLVGGTLLAFIVWSAGRKLYLPLNQNKIQDPRDVLRLVVRKAIPLFLFFFFILLAVVVYQVFSK